MSERRFHRFSPLSLSLSLSVDAVASLSRIWLLATFMLSPTRTHICLLSHSHVQWHAEAVAAFGSASLFKCPLGEAILLSPMADCACLFVRSLPSLFLSLSLSSSPSSFLFALPFVPDAVFNCFAPVYLLFIYVSFHLHCLFSVAYAVDDDDQADNLIVSLSVYLSPSPLLPLSSDYYVFCMQSAVPTANER